MVCGASREYDTSGLVSHKHSRSSSDLTHITNIIIIGSAPRAQSVLVIMVAFIDRNTFPPPNAKHIDTR